MMAGEDFQEGVAVVVLVSADAEWRVVRAMFPGVEIEETPIGAWFRTGLVGSGALAPVVFFHGGWGKIAAAASTQYVIDRWQPGLLVNLGTCGGFGGLVERGEVILVERSVVYDIVEQMSDPDEAIAHYATEIDLSWVGEDDPTPVRRSPIVSADRDLVAEEVTELARKFGAVAGDWESGAIAWVAARHGIPCLILRGVTDLVDEGGGEAYDGNAQAWVEVAEGVMGSLVEQLPLWLERAMAGHEAGAIRW